MVVRLRAGRGPAALAPVTGSDVRFHTDDRLDAGLFGLLLKVPGRVQIAVVRDGEGGLFELLRAPNQIVYPVGSIQ